MKVKRVFFKEKVKKGEKWKRTERNSEKMKKIDKRKKRKRGPKQIDFFTSEFHLEIVRQSRPKRSTV